MKMGKIMKVRMKWGDKMMMIKIEMGLKLGLRMKVIYSRNEENEEMVKMGKIMKVKIKWGDKKMMIRMKVGLKWR